MIAQWMAYSAAVGLLLFAGAAAGERVVRALGLPARGVWAAAVAATLVAPFTLGSPGRPFAIEGSSAAGLLSEGAAASRTPVLQSVAVERLDVLLLGLWAAASLFLLLRLGLAAYLGRRRSAKWRGAKVGGSWVEISGTTGPAVIGFLNPRIVLPEWTLGLDARSLRLLLEHEREHVRAGDPRLLLAGLLAVAALPWNPALWLQGWRLRHAVEIDCDRRVVRWTGDRRRYGELLLAVAGRTLQRPAPAGVFAAASPPLERRIRSIAGEPPIRRASLPAFAGAALLLPALAALIPAPSPPALAAVAVSALRGAAPAPAEVPVLLEAPPQLVNRHQAPVILGRAYPPALRRAGIGGTVVLWSHIRPDGRVDRSTVLESSGHPELDEAAQHAMHEFRFRPALVEGRPSAAWKQQPVTFVPETGARGLAVDRSGDQSPRVAIWRTPATTVAMIAIR